MATEPDLRREIADERRELTNAVSDLRKELDETAERGKRIGVKVGAAAGALIALRPAPKVRRRPRDDWPLATRPADPRRSATPPRRRSRRAPARRPRPSASPPPPRRPPGTRATASPPRSSPGSGT